MLLQCEFLYDITQTVHLTSGSWSGACRMCNAVTSYRQAMPSALSTTHLHFPLSQIAAAEVASCDHGPTLWPTGPHHSPLAHAGRRIMHWFLSAVTQHSAVSSVQCHCYSRVMSDHCD